MAPLLARPGAVNPYLTSTPYYLSLEISQEMGMSMADYRALSMAERLARIYYKVLSNRKEKVQTDVAMEKAEAERKSRDELPKIKY